MEPKFSTPQNRFSVDYGNCTVKADGDYIGKISGTMMAGILGCSPWSSRFTVACELLGLGTEDISSKPAIQTGHILEGRIIDYASKTYSNLGTFLSADVVFGKREGEHSTWEPDFEDAVFTGHVDGLVMTPDGEDYILEVKTSSNVNAWLDGVPEYYFWQVALYDRFIAHKGKAYLVKGAVSKDTYLDVESWVPSEDNVTMYAVELDHDKVEAGIKEAMEWYEELKQTRKTPPADMSRPADATMFNHLCDLDNCDKAFEDLLDEYGNIKNQLKGVEDEYKWLTDKEEHIKGLIKTHMELNGISDAESKSGRYSVSLSSSKRKALDPALLKDAGIDPEPYYKETVYKTLRMREPKVRDIWQ